MARDITFGGLLTGVVAVQEGHSVSGNILFVVVKHDEGNDTTVIYTASDIEDWGTYTAHDAASTGIAGIPSRIAYSDAGQFAIGTSTGGVYRFSQANLPSDALSVSVADTAIAASAIEVSALSWAGADWLVGVGNILHTLPRAGGDSVLRLDVSVSIPTASQIVDSDYSTDGHFAIVRRADGAHVIVTASSDWNTVQTAGFDTDLTDSPVREVNYDEISSLWFAAREDGVVIESSDLVVWTVRGAASPPPVLDALWVTAGENGNISYSEDAASWTTYQVPVGTNVGNRSVSYGLDANGDGLWMTSRWWDTVGEAGMTSDITAGVSGWTISNTPIRSGIDAAFGNGVWVMVGRTGTARSTDFGATWNTVTSTGSEDINTAALNASVATDGSGNWVIIADDGSQYKVYKSTDDGATWSVSLVWGWLAAAQNALKEVSYGNGVWVLATSDNVIRTCTDAGLATNSWEIVTTLSGQPRDIQYGDLGIWMAVGTDKKCWVSTDNAASWSEQSPLHHAQAPGIYAGVHAVNVAYYDGSWIAVMDTATLNNVFKSDDNGFTWAAIANTGEKLAGIAYSSVLPNS
jgi:hypothetical protein